jgi:hypothetical protein
MFMRKAGFVSSLMASQIDNIFSGNEYLEWWAEQQFSAGI